jgi:hypothetical protein
VIATTTHLSLEELHEEQRRRAAAT